MLEPFDDKHPHIDDAAFVHRAAVVIGEVSVGPGSSIWPNTTLRGDDGPIVIGAHSSIQDGTVVHNTEGHSVTTVGDRVTVGHNAILHGCTIEDDCLIGMGAIVLDNAVVERGSIVGAGTLVSGGRVVASGSVVVGNPMRVLRISTEKDAAWIEHAWREYAKRCEQYRAAAR